MLENLGGFWSDSGEMMVNLDILFDRLATFMLYVTLVLLAALVVYVVAIRNRDEQYLANSRKLIAGVALGYSASTVCLLGYLKLLHYVIDEKINTNFWLMVGLAALVAVGIVLWVALQKKHAKGSKWAAFAFIVAFAVYAVVLVFVVPAKSQKYEPLDSTALMYVISALLVAAIVVLAMVFGKPSAYNAKALTYAAICIALSFALSYVKFFSLPQGGSVTFASLLPLALYSYMFGTRRGVIAGVVYGLLQFVQSPQFYQPMQALLDYPIAFGAIGIAGMARNFKFLKGNVIAEFAFGTTVAVLFRYLSHVVSGYFVFSSWAMEGYTALSWAVVYNLYTIADLAIVLVMGILALSSKTLRRTVLFVEESTKNANPQTAQN